MAFFEENGCALKTERGNRVFPVSDRSMDVLNALLRAMRAAGVQHRQGSAQHILTENGQVCGVQTAEEMISCRAAILCTGGASYPLTGSTGDGFRMAAALGHTITPVAGSLVPLVSEDADCAQMQGLSLRNTACSTAAARRCIRILVSFFSRISAFPARWHCPPRHI